MDTEKKKRNIIVGSVRIESDIQPFSYSPEDNTLVLDKYEMNPLSAALSEEEKQKIRDKITGSIGCLPDEVRFGEYFCSECREWIELDGNQWSLGVCLSCSMDRDSDMADSF